MWIRKWPLLLLVVLSASCTSVPPTTYYTLLYEEASAPHCDAPLPVILGVPGFQASAGRDRVALAFRSSDVEMGFYNYREWLVRPDRLLTEVLIRSLVDSGCFEAVVSPPYLEPVDLELAIVLESLEQVDANQSSAAAIGWRSVLLDREGQVVWRKKTRRQESLPPKSGASEVVHALNEMANEEIAALITQLREQVEKLLDKAQD